MTRFERFSWRHWLGLLLALVLTAVSLPHAGAQDNQAGSVPLNPEVSGEVEFWHFWGSPVRRTAIRRVVAICEDKLPNIDVEEVYKPWGDIWTANITAVAAGSGMPDVIVEDRPQLPRIAADGVQQSLQTFMDEDSFDPSGFYPFTWEQTIYEGQSYGVPFETDVRVLFYNKNLFEQAGLDPENPPQTWEELWQAADALDVVAEDGTIERMAFFPLIGNVGVDLWALSTGHEWVQDGEVVVNDPKVAETLEWIKKWIDRYGGWGNVQRYLAQFGAPPNDAFMSGGVVMKVDTAGYNSQLSFYRPQVRLENGETPPMDWGVSLPPYEEVPVSTSGGFALSIPAGAENPEAAWEFIKCASSIPAQVSWSRDTYAIPSTVAAARNPELTADPNWNFFVDAMEVSSSLPFVPSYPNWMQELNNRYEQIWTGELTVEEALEQAQQAIDAEMGN